MVALLLLGSVGAFLWWCYRWRRSKRHSDAAEAEAAPWHAMPIERLLEALEVDPEAGLDEKEVVVRRRRYGANEFYESPPTPLWVLFLRQFKSLLILILIGASVLAWIVGDLKDAWVILGVVFINANLGFYQEHRAERSLSLLKNKLVLQAEVRRARKVTMIPATDLVPGDIVILEAGDRVPADGRILRAHNLQADESSLTGESQPVAKEAGVVSESALPADRSNMLYMNTSITRGRAEMLVTAVGMQTEIGRLAEILAEAEDEPTPLQRQLDRLGTRLAWLAGAVVLVMGIGGWLRGQPWMELIFTAVALAVASIPEGLPAVVTVTLALGLRRMAMQRAIVKRLAAVETLGCTNVICTDKTGTLTLNQMTVRAAFYRGRYWRISGQGYRPQGEIAPESGPETDLTPLILPLVLCNDAKLDQGKVIGDPMEAALSLLADKAGQDRAALRRDWPRIAEIPFDTDYRFMATFHRNGRGSVYAAVKGAPEVVLARCSSVLTEEGIEPLTDACRSAWWGANQALADRGLRVLAVASRRLLEFDPEADLFPYVQDLTLIGWVGLMDPPRPEAKHALDLCRRAGIQVKMITGDQPATAAAIARELGLSGTLLTGSELASLDEDTLASKVESIAVFARTSPEQKVRIVKALKRRGYIVAMTGDGVNDAPALKTADIGVAMGQTGTDVAIEASVMVLTDDNFATIVAAVREGRTIYDNLLKFVRFQLSTNFGAVLTLFAAPFAGLPIPFHPIQILWINMIMDGPPAMALGVDPSPPAIMDVPPRKPTASILNWVRTAHLLMLGLIMLAGTLGVLWWGMARFPSQNVLTLAFTTFVLFQVINVLNIRSSQQSVFSIHSLRNRWLWGALFGVVGLQWAAVSVPAMRVLFQTVPLSAQQWLIALGVASSILVWEEGRKVVARALFRAG